MAKTEGIQFTIRRAEPDDYHAVRRIFEGPKAIRGTLQLPYPSAEMWHKRLAEPPEGSYFLVVLAGDEVVGQLGIETFPRSPRRWHAARIGMAIRDDWQGKGAGTALMQAACEMADRWLNIMRLELEVYTDNEPAVRLYKKFGFVIEGTLVSHAFRDGQYVDSYSMARLHKSA